MRLLQKLAIIFFNHGVSSLLGWCAGLIVVQLINSFLEEEGVTNLWGLWSDKLVVKHSTFTVVSWIGTAMIGWGISELWQRLSSQILKIIQK